MIGLKGASDASDKVAVARITKATDGGSAVDQQPLTVPTLLHRWREAETSTRLLQEPREALDRAERSEKSARDAWAFARGLMRADR